MRIQHTVALRQSTRDNLKIEINYMMRCHILPLVRRTVYLPWNENALTVLCLEPLEIFAAKTVALLNRAAPRDLFDIYKMQKHKLLDEAQNALYKKNVMFYTAIASEFTPQNWLR